ncbi:S53 family peptidase [Aspergillus tanneri]|uniref:tripeptidyl-peptidase II n=1 Tax=Aspergillus tanneri TaxID=1220188 RepID=A0A5M9MEG9_9EURO|nr:uncharacterized protein ATNIH1004_006750 [Aspergillus tanneri]KAA8645331.1 hypothetical protein ATNIH1004_006750 [Aspergillus tanneri]
MMFQLPWTVFLLLLFCGLPYGLHTRDLPYVVKSSVTVPAGWSRIAAPPRTQIINIRIGLQQNQIEDVERHLLEVSDPSHPRYGQHLSAQEVNQLAQPSRVSVDAVTTWLRQHVPDAQKWAFSRERDWLSLSLSVGELEDLLQTEYGIFQHVDGEQHIRCLSWSLPAAVVDHIDVIEPTNVFIRPKAQSRYGGPPPPDWELEHRMPTFAELVDEDILERGHLDIPTREELSDAPSVQEACNRLAISTTCLSVLYGIWGYTQQVPDRNSIALVNFLGEVNNRSDIDLFLRRHHPAAAEAKAAYNFSTEIVADGDNRQSLLSPEDLDAHKGFEGALDAQTILGLSWPMPLTTYNVGSKPPFHATAGTVENTNEPYLTWLEYILAKDTLPNVISISYADDEKTVPPNYARRVCNEFAKLGARGVTVLVASGDWGVGEDAQCFSGSNPEETRFAPSFPASCPYVTSVGGTRLLEEQEIVGFDGRGSFVTGGGFSEIFDQPPYQREAVGTYIADLGDKHAGLYNAAGRGIPDISAMSYHYSVLYNGQAHLQDGTSGSAPTVASIIGMVNDALIAEGRPPLGFLNPWIYSRAHTGFRDVTWGSNRGCNTSGFPATTGWDAATGFGTPWFPALKKLALESKFRHTTPWYAI